MSRSGLITVLCASFVVLAACGKEETAKPAPSSASAPTAPTAPSTPAPATPSAPAPTPSAAGSATPSAAPTAPAQPADSGASGATSALSDTAALDLLAKNACTACHAVDKKVIGPAYQEVAAKYRGQAGAEEKLVQKVKNGGSGVWGPVPMPPNPQVKDDDVRAMVRWILALK